MSEALGVQEASAARRRERRAYWLKTLHQWHWISSALSLLGLLLFAVTGFTLNHATQIEAKPAVTHRAGRLPAALLARLQTPAEGAADTGLPAEVRHWLAASLRVDISPQRETEWSDDEVVVALPEPGGDAWLRIARRDGQVEYERTQRGWVAYLNDLHKGRHTGLAWSWFIDLFALACLVFAITGLFILKLHAANRPTTWPLVGLGLVIPLLLALLFIH